MIVLDLLCDNQHRFEGWFASSDAFRDQCGRQLVQCPVCQTAAIRQLPSAPYVRRGELPGRVHEGVAKVANQGAKGEDVARSDGEEDASLPVALVEIEAKLAQVVRQMHDVLLTLASQAENVGTQFPEEARRIHYEEAPARAIRGVASADETLELLEEGILVLPAPIPPESELH